MNNVAYSLVSVSTMFVCMLNAALSQVTTDSHVIKGCEIVITICHSHKMLIIS